MSKLKEFAQELEKISKDSGVRGAKGRRNLDGIARVSKPLPEPKGGVPKAPGKNRRATLKKMRNF